MSNDTETTKVVYNACYGGFGLSLEATREYLRRTGRTWTERPLGAMNITQFVVEGDPDWYERDIPRTDPVLVAIVEEFGEAAGSAHADLQIKELAKGTLYRIDEYDGWETVETRDAIDWSVA
jgi:hypothetical protein